MRLDRHYFHVFFSGTLRGAPEPSGRPGSGERKLTWTGQTGGKEDALTPAWVRSGFARPDPSRECWDPFEGSKYDRSSVEVEAR